MRNPQPGRWGDLGKQVIVRDESHPHTVPAVVLCVNSGWLTSRALRPAVAVVIVILAPLLSRVEVSMVFGR